MLHVLHTLIFSCRRCIIRSPILVTHLSQGKLWYNYSNHHQDCKHWHGLLAFFHLSPEFPTSLCVESVAGGSPVRHAVLNHGVSATGLHSALCSLRNFGNIICSSSLHFVILRDLDKWICSYHGMSLFSNTGKESSHTSPRKEHQQAILCAPGLLFLYHIILGCWVGTRNLCCFFLVLSISKG